MRKKFLTAFSLLLAVLLLLSACASDGNTGTTEPATEAETPGTVLFSADSSYTIIRGDNAKDTAVQAAVKLRNAVKDVLNSTDTVKIDTDFLMDNKKNLTIDYRACEILVGETNRRESQDILATLTKPTQYVIRTVNDKLVILGGNDYATAEAVKIFIETYLPTEPTDRIVLEGPVDITGERATEGPALAENAAYRLLSWNLGCAVGNLDDVVTILERYMPDIISLQECNGKSYTGAVDKFIAAHPEYKVVKRNHDDGTGLCTPIIYNSDVMGLVTGGCEWLRSRYTGTSTKSIGWAIFEMDGQKFGVLNFHGAVISTSYKGYETMPADERSTLSAEWRYDNAKQLIELKDRIFKLNGEIPITINGDCNFSANGRAFSVFTDDGFIDSEAKADKKGDYGYRTAFSYGSAIPGKGESIDHIVGRSGIHFYYYDVIREEPAVTASDHCPVFVDIGFEIPKE